MDNCTKIVVIVQEHRVETATKVQDVLTEYGCNIRVRLGLHDSAMGSCSNTGMIMIQYCDEDNSVEEFIKKLTAIPSVKAKSMSLDF